MGQQAERPAEPLLTMFCKHTVLILVKFMVTYQFTADSTMNVVIGSNILFISV